MLRHLLPGWLRAIGPGLLFAGAAIGVSHLVQSTRAGALYGLGLLGVVLLANATKYPALSLGTRYTNATGMSLLEAYRRQGRWALFAFALFSFGTMFAVVAAVTFVTAALFHEMLLRHFWPSASLQVSSVILLTAIGLLLRRGGFRWLDGTMKVLLATMALLTSIATLVALLRVDWSTFALFPPAAATRDMAALGFVVALAGWMPAPLDVSVWSSVWAQAQAAERGRASSWKETRFDFDLGFSLCVVLAVCFMVLGTVSMHQAGVQLEAGGVAFSRQLVALFTNELGAWSYPLVVISAFAVMFSTTLTVVDAFPRVLTVMSERFMRPEETSKAAVDHSRKGLYWVWLGVMMLGSLLVLFFFTTSLKGLVDVATTLSFVTAPAFAYLNHRAIFSEEVRGDFRPGRLMALYSQGSILLLASFSLFFLYYRFAL